MGRHRTFAVLAAILVLAASCTSEPERDLPDVDIDAPAETSPDAPAGGLAPTTPSDVAVLAGRLTVLDPIGNLVTVNPDGSNEVVLAEVEPGRSQVRQPTWSRDGNRVAWVQVELTDDGGFSSVVATSTADGTRPTEATTSTVPFYLSWDPTSSRIAYLGSPSAAQIELGIVELGRGRGTTLDEGQPFYLSWSPEGDQLLVHVGKDRLERLGLDGSLTTVAARPGTFSAPVWTGDGETFVYASVEPGGQRLVVHAAGEEAGQPFVPFDGSVTFVVSPDGERIAFQVIEEAGSLPLTVIDLRTSETVEVTEAPTAGYFWSPDGERLLYLDPDPEVGQLWFRWGVWDGTSSFVTPRFVPSLLMAREYLPFFEQYAQSMSLWSPDGSAFAYPGTDEDGETGIWVQAARPDRAPVLVAEGEFVAWSPT
jgi:Tol biopolymer transport system component